MAERNDHLVIYTCRIRSIGRGTMVWYERGPQRIGCDLRCHKGVGCNRIVECSGLRRGETTARASSASVCTHIALHALCTHVQWCARGARIHIERHEAHVAHVTRSHGTTMRVGGNLRVVSTVHLSLPCGLFHRNGIRSSI